MGKLKATKTAIKTWTGSSGHWNLNLWQQPSVRFAPFVGVYGCASVHFCVGQLLLHNDKLFLSAWPFWSGAVKQLLFATGFYVACRLLAKNAVAGNKAAVGCWLILAASDLLLLLIRRLCVDSGYLIAWRIAWFWWLLGPIVVTATLMQLALAGTRAWIRDKWRPKRESSTLAYLASVPIALLGLSFTALHLLLPRLAGTPNRLWLTSKCLVASNQMADYSALTTDNDWSMVHIGVLLEHLELGNLERTHFYQGLSQEIYDNFVLSPSVDTLPLEEPAWRKSLWEAFSPLVRQTHDPVAGAAIVVRALREQVGISPQFSSRVGVETIWAQRMTDQKGFARIYVAALRSVGLAARLQAAGITEMWTGDRWSIAPQPSVVMFGQSSQTRICEVRK